MGKHIAWGTVFHKVFKNVFKFKKGYVYRALYVEYDILTVIKGDEKALLATFHNLSFEQK